MLQTKTMFRTPVFLPSLTDAFIISSHPTVLPCHTNVSWQENQQTHLNVIINSAVEDMSTAVVAQNSRWWDKKLLILLPTDHEPQDSHCQSAPFLTPTLHLTLWYVRQSWAASPFSQKTSVCLKQPFHSFQDTDRTAAEQHPTASAKPAKHSEEQNQRKIIWEKEGRAMLITPFWNRTGTAVPLSWLRTEQWQMMLT